MQQMYFLYQRMTKATDKSVDFHGRAIMAWLKKKKYDGGQYD